MDSERPFILGHRGIRGRLENTMPAFRRAMRYAEGIEFDVRLTGDRKLIAHHDSGFWADGSFYRLEDLTLREIQRLHPLGRLIPRVETILRAFPNAVFNADVKEAEAIEVLLRAMERSNAVDRAVFSSEDPRIVHRLIRNCPDCRVGFSIVGYSAIFHIPKMGGLYSVHVPLDAVVYIGYRPLIILLRWLRKRGLRVCLWNYEMEELLWIPRLTPFADVIISDDPARLRKSFYAKGIALRGDANVGEG